jgi:hypothetical protein
VTQQQVAYDLKKIRERFVAVQILERGAAVAEKLEQLRDIRWEAWQAWERSKNDKGRVDRLPRPAMPWFGRCRGAQFLLTIRLDPG